MSKHTSQATKDLKEIKKWAEERDGKPSIVKGTEDSKKRIKN